MFQLDYEADITILGVSTIGVAAALAFVRQGFRVCLFDRAGPGEAHDAGPPQPVGALALRFLSSLDIGYNAYDEPQVKAWLFKDAKGEPLADLIASDHKGELPEQRFVNPDYLRQSMLSRLKGNSRFTLRSGHAAFDLQLDEGAAYVIGQTYDKRQFIVRSLFVIDTDEALSVVNKTINAPIEAVRKARTWLTLLLNAPDPSLRCHLGYYHDRPLVRMPLGLAGQRWCLAAKEGDTREDLSSKDFITRFLANTAGLGTQSLKNISLQDYPMSMRTKLWEHRTALIGAPSLHLSDEQGWLGDSLLDIGLVDLAELVWPLFSVLVSGMSINVLKHWDQSRLAYRRVKADHHKLAGDLVFRAARSTMVGRVTKMIKQSMGDSEEDQYYQALLFANPQVPKGLNANRAKILNQVIPHARVLAAFTPNKQLASDLQSFNEVPIKQGRLDEILPLGYSLLCLGDRSISAMAAEAYHFFNTLPMTPILVLSRHESPQPASVVDVDGAIADWLAKAEHGSPDKGIIALIAPDRSCAAVFTPEEATEQIGLFCKAFGLELPHFVETVPDPAPLSDTALDEVASSIGASKLRSKASMYVKKIFKSRGDTKGEGAQQSAEPAD